MVRISKRKLSDAVKESIGEQLLLSIVHARSRKDAHALLSELLGSEERIVLAKRFATVAMLMRGYSIGQIEDMLKISPDTINRIWKDIQKGRYQRVIRYTKNNPRKFEGDSFLDMLEKLLQAGLPPRGRGRWAFLRAGTFD
jgi:uncharacterized protein YerC